MRKHPCLALLAAAVGLWTWQATRSQEEEPGFITSSGYPGNAEWVARTKRELAVRSPSLRTLALEKRTAARKAFAARADEYAAGKTTIADFVLEAANKLREAELAVSATPGERVEALERCWLWAKWLEAINKAKFDAGTIGPNNYYPVVYARLHLESELISARKE